MMEINDNNEEGELPMQSNKKGFPQASKDKLISSGSRINRIRRKKDLDEPQRSQDEQIYNKNALEDKEEKENNQPEKIQIEFMKPSGSFIYQTLLEFHRIYTIVYFIIEELLFVYKCHFFDFPEHAAGIDIFCLILYLFIQLGRIYFGSLGNRAEAHVFILWSLILSFIILWTYAHFCFWQAYVLRIELITNGIGFAFWLFELVFSLIAFIGISTKASGI